MALHIIGLKLILNDRTIILSGNAGVKHSVTLHSSVERNRMLHTWVKEDEETIYIK